MNDGLVHILFRFKDGPWGGGNQFLKALRHYFIEKNVYTENPEDASIILFNSNPGSFYEVLKDLYELKRKRPELIVVNRVDGPINLIRGKDMHIDNVIFRFNKMVCDATVFQSTWSKAKCREQGLQEVKCETTVFNAPDPSIFNRSGKRKYSSGKVKLIANSWSDNTRKGFDIYGWLDENLDFRKYEMTFVGNSPIRFRNLRHLNPMDSASLADELKKNDIYITASLSDPCSNSLIEALHCGLPAIARNDGGHPEIVGAGGLTFQSPEEIPSLLGRISEDYHNFQSSINLPSMNEVGDKYRDFLSGLLLECRNRNYIPKRFTKRHYLILKIMLDRGKFLHVFKSFLIRRFVRVDS